MSEAHPDQTNRAAFNMIVKTLQIIPKFFQSTASGGLDPNKSLTGPIGIFRLLKVSAEKCEQPKLRPVDYITNRNRVTS